jgi:hypothetical protein
MKDMLEVSTKAARDIENYLSNNFHYIKVINVEKVSKYQLKDIDLVLITPDKNVTIEIKADRWNKTGNFFFETLSNEEKGTLGCFLYSEADFLYYYFINTKTLYSLPMIKSREWFLANISRFKEVKTRTKVRNSFYTTVGRIVPISVVLKEVDGIKIMEVGNDKGRKA